MQNSSHPYGMRCYLIIFWVLRRSRFVGCSSRLNWSPCSYVNTPSFIISLITIILFFTSLLFSKLPILVIFPFYLPGFWSYPSLCSHICRFSYNYPLRENTEHLSFDVCQFYWIAYLPQCVHCLFHPFPCKVHNFICIYSWTVFHSVLVSHFHYPFISCRSFSFLLFSSYCE